MGDVVLRVFYLFPITEPQHPVTHRACCHHVRESVQVTARKPHTLLVFKDIMLQARSWLVIVINEAKIQIHIHIDAELIHVNLEDRSQLFRKDLVVGLALCDLVVNDTKSLDLFLWQILPANHRHFIQMQFFAAANRP